MLPVYNIDYISENENGIQLTISDQLFLEVLLMEIRGKTISYSSYKKKQKTLQEDNLQAEINKLEEATEIDLEILEQKKSELENLRKEKLQGIMIRARIRWAEEGEKPTKYFCSLESRNYVNKTIPKVQRDDGSVINNQESILNEVKIFYADLYKFHEREQSINYQDILSKIRDYPTLSVNEKLNLEEEIDEEIASVLKKMKNNKSPGSDGFTVEIFIFFTRI